MKKIKKMLSKLYLRLNIIKSYFSDKRFKKAMNNYLRFIGVDLHGDLNFCAKDVVIDFYTPSLIHIGGGTYFRLTACA